jgi:hypothetical protein
MKTNVRNEDAITSAMGWLDQLREDGHAEPVSESDREPEAPREAEVAGEAKVAGEPEAASEPAACAPVDASRPPNSASGRHEMRESAEIIEPAPIGDALRIPIAWCEMGSCISHYEHPAALGEADIRARAIEAGWKVDALGRLACPQCQRSGPWFWTTHPIVPWDRRRAVTAVAAMTTAAREDATGGAGCGAGRGVIQAVAPPLVPLPAQGRHRESLGDFGRAG